MPISITECIARETIKCMRYKNKEDFNERIAKLSKEIRKLSRLGKQILNQGLMVETTPGFRRCAYPDVVELCDEDCNAGYNGEGKETCCHRYVLSGIVFCRENNLKNRLTYGTNYTLEQNINGRWVEVDKEEEFRNRIKSITRQ